MNKLNKVVTLRVIAAGCWLCEKPFDDRDIFTQKMRCSGCRIEVSKDAMDEAAKAARNGYQWVIIGVDKEAHRLVCKSRQDMKGEFIQCHT